MRYSGAEIIVKFMEKEGIKYIAGIPGGANLPVYTALAESKKIKHILARHEQGAGFIAHGIARSTGRAAVCFATSGPGATNLMTAIADAKMDSVPIIAITGQVPGDFKGTDAFQEVDTCSMSESITKKNYYAESAGDLLQILPEAFYTATEGRPGPVLIDIPKDVQKETIDIDGFLEISIKEKRPEINEAVIIKAAEMINRSRRPILYIGGGAISSGARDLIYKLSDKNSIPATTTLMGLGSYPHEDEKNIGMLGMHGKKHTNIIIEEADLLIAIGARFDDRATGAIEKFCTHADILHIDIDSSEIDKIKKSNCSIISDAGHALEKIIPLIDYDDRPKWMKYIKMEKKKQAYYENRSKNLSNPIEFIRSIAYIIPEDSIITTDVGQHQMWTAQAYPFKSPRTLLTSGGLGTMGFGLPAAIGAALANPGKTVICISGDGSILMNIQELATLAEESLNVKIIIFNNGHLGLVRQQQELFYDKTYMATKFKVNPDFCTIAESMGIAGVDFTGEDDINSALYKELIKKGSVLINMPIKHTENVYPMVAPGKGNYEMIT